MPYKNPANSSNITINNTINDHQVQIQDPIENSPREHVAQVSMKSLNIPVAYNAPDVDTDISFDSDKPNMVNAPRGPGGIIDFGQDLYMRSLRLIDPNFNENFPNFNMTSVVSGTFFGNNFMEAGANTPTINNNIVSNAGTVIHNENESSLVPQIKFLSLQQLPDPDVQISGGHVNSETSSEDL